MSSENGDLRQSVTIGIHAKPKDEPYNLFVGSVHGNERGIAVRAKEGAMTDREAMALGRAIQEVVRLREQWAREEQVEDNRAKLPGLLSGGLAPGGEAYDQ